MQPFTTHTGRAVALRRTNVDTDQIIPAVYLKRVTRDGFGDGLFAAWREDPSFVLNQPRYEGATILVAGAGLRTVVRPEKAVALIQDAAEAEPPAQVTVDLDKREVRVSCGGLAEDLVE